MSLLTISKLGESVGAEVTGLDPERVGSDDVAAGAILDALAQCHGNKKKAAERLGIQRPTLYNKMKRYGIQI